MSASATLALLANIDGTAGFFERLFGEDEKEVTAPDSAPSTAVAEGAVRAGPDPVSDDRERRQRTVSN